MKAGASPMELLPNYQNLGIASKGKCLNKYLNLKSQDSNLPINLRTAKQDLEGEASGSFHWPCKAVRASQGPFPGGEAFREIPFYQKDQIDLHRHKKLLWAGRGCSEGMCSRRWVWNLDRLRKKTFISITHIKNREKIPTPEDHSGLCLRLLSYRERGENNPKSQTPTCPEAWWMNCRDFNAPFGKLLPHYSRKHGQSCFGCSVGSVPREWNASCRSNRNLINLDSASSQPLFSWFRREIIAQPKLCLSHWG